MEWVEGVWEWVKEVWEWPYFDQGVATVTALGVIGAPAVWAIKRRWNGHQTRKTAAKGLCAELEDTMKALGDASRHQQFEETIIDPETTSGIKTCKKIRWTLAFLNHDAYDGFLHAGHLAMLDAELVQEIQDIYQLIKRHNMWLEYMMPLRDKESETGEANLAVTSTYYDILDKHECKLLETIPGIEKRLENLSSFWPWVGRWTGRV